MIPATAILACLLFVVAAHRRIPFCFATSPLIGSPRIPFPGFIATRHACYFLFLLAKNTRGTHALGLICLFIPSSGNGLTATGSACVELLLLFAHCQFGFHDDPA